MFVCRYNGIAGRDQLPYKDGHRGVAMKYTSHNRFEIGSERFQLIEWVSDLGTLKDEDGFVVGKTRRGIDKYVEHVDPSKVRNVFELGIYRGGSVVFFDSFLKPHKLVAIDIEGPVPVLEDWIDRTGSRDRISTFYNVDQADTVRMVEVYRSVFADEQLDLVLDDASHLLEQTRASFNLLFPHLNHGGLYIIEDWAWAECFRGYEELLSPVLRNAEPMSRLIHEIVVASARAPKVIDEVVVSDGFVLVRRGDERLDGHFDIRNHA